MSLTANGNHEEQPATIDRFSALYLSLPIMTERDFIKLPTDLFEEAMKYCEEIVMSAIADSNAKGSSIDSKLDMIFRIRTKLPQFLLKDKIDQMLGETGEIIIRMMENGTWPPKE